MREKFLSLPSNTFFLMDFFERHFKKIVFAWLLWLFLMWLVPRIVVDGKYLLVDSFAVMFSYCTLFVLSITAFIITAFIEIISTKNYKLIRKLFFIVVVPVTLLATTGVYRSIMDEWGTKIPYYDSEKAKKNDVFYAQYDVSPMEVIVNDTTIIHFGEAVGQYYKEKNRFRLLDFPTYYKSDRKCIVLNCSVNNPSMLFTNYLWHCSDAYVIYGPKRYGKKGKPIVEIPLKENASDTILIALKHRESLELVDTIRLVKMKE